MTELLLYLNSIYPLSEGLEQHLSAILKLKELPRKTYLLKAGHLCRAENASGCAQGRLAAVPIEAPA